jgi:hypothetical protein
MLIATNRATMVTATLPSLTDETEDIENERSPRKRHQRISRQSIAFSVESELTITPERYTRTVSSDRVPRGEQDSATAPGKAPALAGYVGLATGCGALVALVLFLPLPTRFGSIDNVTQAEAVSYSFYVVGVISLLVAVFVFFGMRNLPGEEGKGWSVLLGLKNKTEDGAHGEDSARSEVSSKGLEG